MPSETGVPSIRGGADVGAGGQPPLGQSRQPPTCCSAHCHPSRLPGLGRKPGAGKRESGRQHPSLLPPLFWAPPASWALRLSLVQLPGQAGLMVTERPWPSAPSSDPGKRYPADRAL